MRRDPIGLLVDAVRTYGETVGFRMLNRHVVLLTDPVDVRHVLQDNYRNYDKSTPGFKVLRRFLADGLLTNEGDAWLRQRRIIQPGFHRERIAGFARTMTAAAEALANEWDAGGSRVIDVSAAMMRLTLRIVGETLLSTDVSHSADRVGQALSVSLEAARVAINRTLPVPDWLPTPRNVRRQRAFRALDDVVYGMIASRHQDDRDHGDLLQMLMDARDEETGEGMSDRQLRDEVMTIFLAGHETTAIALGWIWYLLSTHPAALDHLEEEVRARPAGRALGLEDLPHLGYTEQVVREAMRLYPPAWIVSRCAIGPDRVGGHEIAPGTIVFASPFVTHRLERLWDNPEGFLPERFAEGRADAIPPFAYFPFGGGPRQCIGNTFAMMEMVLVVGTLARRGRLHLAPGHHPPLRPAITLRPGHPIVMTRHPATGAASGASVS